MKLKDFVGKTIKEIGFDYSMIEIKFESGEKVRIESDCQIHIDEIKIRTKQIQEEYKESIE